MKSILRKTHQRFIFWGLLDLVVTLVAIGGLSLIVATALNLLEPPTGVQKVGMYIWWVVALVLVAWRVAVFFVALFNSKGILERLEQTHPEYRNELSTLVYLDAHGDEVKHLGFSPALIKALRKEVEELPPPQWARLGLSPTTRKSLLGLGAVGAAALIGFILFSPGYTQKLVRAHLYGEQEILTESTFPVDLPGKVEVPFRHELTLSREGEDPYLHVDFTKVSPDQKLDLLAKTEGNEWRVVGRISGDNSNTIAPLSLSIDRPTQICFSGEEGLSTVCEVVPVYPPAVESTEVAIEAPDYTGKPRTMVSDSERIEAFEGSRIAVDWKTNGPVLASTLEILSPTRSVLESTPLVSEASETFSHRFDLADNTHVRLTLSDRFGQRGMSDVLHMIAVADGSPEVEILSPTREVTLPPDLRIPIKMTARDDIGLSTVEMIYRVDNGMPAGGQYHREVLADHLAGLVGGATPFIGETVLDLSALDLWPGDQVVYWFEATDYRGDLPPGKGLSPNYFVRYPTVEENLDEMASVREKSVDGMQELLDEQKQINRQFEEIRKDLQRNRSNLTDPDFKFDTQKKLADTYQQQQELQQKLAEAGEQFDETVKRLSENEDQALRTLHKFQRVQELMDELMTEESKKILQELQETLKQLQKDELRPEELEQTEQTLQDFEKQLDRQLALLENIWMEQELEALRDQAEELAQRQEELKDSTMDQLSEEDKEEVERDTAEPESGVEDSEQNMEERLDEMIDNLEKKIEEKQESGEDGQSKQETAESDQQKDPAKSESESSKEKTSSDESKKQDANGEEQEQTASGEKSDQAKQEEESADKDGLNEKEAAQ
ncbi:MAG: hypothetical protein KC994_19865, partial [Candidatus Omnitrophica bacterium]|nr:hypothetical protein [Candidatus Omnitrophota bacterium]